GTTAATVAAPKPRSRAPRHRGSGVDTHKRCCGFASCRSSVGSSETAKDSVDTDQDWRHRGCRRCRWCNNGVIRRQPQQTARQSLEAQMQSRTHRREPKGHSFRPLLVSFSGIDGAGKTTQIERLTACFRRAGLRVSLVAYWENV